MLRFILSINISLGMWTKWDIWKPHWTFPDCFCFILCFPFFLEARGCRGGDREVDLYSQFLLLLLFSHYAMGNSLRPHGLQHFLQTARLHCPSLSLRVCSNSCPLNWWCHPNISSSVAPFSSCPQSFPVSGSFPINQLFTSDGQNTGASATYFIL